MDEKGRERKSSLVGPVILIGLGVIFLLNNFGILDWSVWDVIFRLWPVLIVAAGLDILIGRRSAWGALLSLALTCALIAGALWLYASGVVATSSEVEEIGQSLDEATAAQIVIGPAVGSVYVDALAESNQLVSGVIRPIRGERVQRDFTVQGGTATFYLQSGGNFVSPFIGGVGSEPNWDLSVSSDVPLELEVSLGVGESNVDLTGLMLDDLEVSIGIGQMTIVLPDEGNFQARIDGAIGNTVIIIPAEMEARIYVDTGLAARDLPNGYRQRDGAYESSGYDDAENRIELEIDQAIGNVTVQQGR